MKEKTFSDMVNEEIVNTLMNQYDYDEKRAEKYANRLSNRIEGEMWNCFDKELEEIMSRKLSKQKED